MYKKILVCTDGSQISDIAVSEGVQLAKQLGSEVVVFHVVPEVPQLITPYTDWSGDAYKTITEEMQKGGEEVLKNVAESYADRGITVQTKLARGNVSYEICREAGEGGYDLVVMSSRGLGEIKGYLMGSVSNRVVKHAPCSVLVVRK